MDDGFLTFFLIKLCILAKCMNDAKSLISNKVHMHFQPLVTQNRPNFFSQNHYPGRGKKLKNFPCITIENATDFFFFYLSAKLITSLHTWLNI